ncbi:MAG: RNA polymerase-associated protein RapA, partial [Gammaproteobacteria bacterium]|nr:RNA polymerase-associated protein RapA [Gammaproteobacteria bacterium]
MTKQFIPGQRWISEAEPQLGLGTILKKDLRSVTILFLATGDTRTYAQASAPLSRVEFKPGDKVQSHEGWFLEVEQTDENEGLITYFGRKPDGESCQLEEAQLNNFIQLSRPADRLFGGQVDADKWFDLRIQTLYAAQKLAKSDIRGMIGPRTDLLEHQVYIAHEVARRYAPRVLLADEVGLGKTIEACMILHHQLITGLASRILIVVPETLTHQWLVELMRRFNLHFSVFDEERCIADEESSQIENPFHNEQLIICSTQFLSENPHRHQQAIEGSWDMLVVDEAHHLRWTPEQVSPEYAIIEALSHVSKGVLLLTATPEQLGKEGHFARLRLLDPARFHNLEAFELEEQRYTPIAQAMEQILEQKPVDKKTVASLKAIIGEEDATQLEKLDPKGDNDEFIKRLLDTHGTGRILFRNTRQAIKGFPQRELHAHPLALPEEYRLPLEEFESTGVLDPQSLLSPELLYQQLRQNSPAAWTKFDPRVDWLTQKIKQLKPEKCLLICANRNTALELAAVLRAKAGLHAGVFHEGMNIIERDRAASYFADPEGTQLLICSEIGSEGRNFQFARNLILFDLPYNPDLLEQRIGRLDRIGQKHTIQIHVPYLEESAQALMFQWYHQGLDAFEQICHVGQSIFNELGETLLEALHQLDTKEEFELLIATTKSLYAQYLKQLHDGRDKLLEYNSCRKEIAQEIIESIRGFDDSEKLQDYMELVFVCFDIEMEEHIDNSFIIRPNPHMPIVAFPELPEDGTTISYDRQTALHHEDMRFISWEHPMV